MNRMTRITLGLAGLATSMTLGIGTAQARELVYYQDWQEADAFTSSWISTGGCTTFSRDPAHPPLDVQSVTPVAPDCSGRYEAETIRWSGGRSSARTTFTVAQNEKYCVTVWIRANGAGANRAQPYVGLNYSASATGFPDDQGSVGGCRNGEHWLIGDPARDGELLGFNDNSDRNTAAGCDVNSDTCCSGRSTSGYGIVTPVPLDAVGWNFYAKDFQVKPSDVLGGTNHVILKLQNFSNGGSDSCGAAAPSADFDDLRVYKLAAGETCAMDPAAIAATIGAGDDAHTVCNGTKPFCTSTNVPVTVVGEAVARQVPQTSCAACTAGYGTAVETACPEATPGCKADGSCGECDGDSGTGTQQSCGAGHPVCTAAHLCSACMNNNDCNAAAGVTRGGNLCVLGRCTATCTIDANGASTACGDNRFCVQTEADPGCRDKLDNGVAIPIRAQEAAADQGKCRLPADGVPHTTATIFCASGVCSKADDKCGLAAGEACTQESGAAQCRSGVCGGDNKCGLENGAACTDNVQCRAGDCIDGNCGGAQLECTPDNVATTCGPTGFACDATSHCAIGCQNGAHCPAGKQCNSADLTIGACVDIPSTSSSSGATSSSSGGSTSSSSGNPSSSSGGSTSSSSGNNTSGGTSSSSGDAPSGSSSGDNAGDGGGDDGGGCSTSAGGAGSLTPMLFGLGLALGALRRRRGNGANQ